MSEAKPTDPPAGRKRKILVIVDDAPESALAVYFAARRAKNAGAVVALLHIIEPSTFEHWMTVEETMRREAQEAAEALIRQAAEEVRREAGLDSEQIIREGKFRDVIRDVIAQDPTISSLVIGAKAGDDNPGRHVSTMMSTPNFFGDRPIPIVIIPSDMTREAIRRVS